MMHLDLKEITIASDSSQLERIGQGFCGTVWATKCPACDMKGPQHSHVVIKREDGGPGRSLPNEYRIHQRILKCLDATTTANITTFNIPYSGGFIDSEASDWAGLLPRLPTGYTSCNGLISEKISPVSTPVRKLLVEKLLPVADPEQVLGSESNKHCLIRPYLGRRRHHQGESSERQRRRQMFFSLRNFALHVDQMEEIGLDPHDYAVAMADALAFLHWSARIDANDVEFVLGSPRSKAQSCDGSGTPKNEVVLGPHAVWILDFDCCREMPMDENGISQAARCFWRNDPFYPRPGSTNATDQHLWDIFQSRFLISSAEILKDEADEVGCLPRRLVDMIVETRGAFTKG